ncbi:EamA-like transporter family protein [Mesocricetibacter intestinalis]|uniref:EamA-like transporter family protein n=1 Tax=Mesocricetibacter intestinalis TaxID=1521930 RepID=A0A4V6PX01_9PAST|nr:EamA family transporter [Mesocricetibacter intestinalis]TDQ59022.1 EamA-like transporter family protein [Mesocricetibacter intestinalis]
MLNLILAVLCSVAVSVLLKIARRRNIVIRQAIAFNYILASALSYYVLTPDFKGLGFTEFVLQSEQAFIFLALGILLPSVFMIMSKAVEYAGIVRADAAQRLSLFLPIIAAFVIFGETLSSGKLIGIILAFVALCCLLYKAADKQLQKGGIALAFVWLGYGVIDILFKQVAKSGAAFPATLFIAFILSACVMFGYLLFKREIWTVPGFIGGIILGGLNFMNILFYIKAHQSLSANPSLVFAGMNIGVICLGSITGALVFKEKISRVNLAGILLGIAAILVLFYFNQLFG